MGSQLMLTQRPLRDELASWARDYAGLRAVPRQARSQRKGKKRNISGEKKNFIEAVFFFSLLLLLSTYRSHALLLTACFRQALLSSRTPLSLAAFEQLIETQIAALQAKLTQWVVQTQSASASPSPSLSNCLATIMAAQLREQTLLSMAEYAGLVAAPLPVDPLQAHFPVS